MTSLVMFAAQSWWNLFVTVLLFALIGGMSIGAVEAAGRSVAACIIASVAREQAKREEGER